MSSDPSRAVVLGAGVSGLKSALHLLGEGYDVEILEKLDDAGGMARSHEMGGFIFDHGPHGFFTSEEWLVEEFKRLVGGEEGYHWLTKWSQIHYRSEYFNYPLKLIDLVSKMSPFKLVSAFCWYLAARARLFVTRRPATNAEEYLLDQYGRVLYREFFGPYTRKVWGVEPTELAADFTRDRVPELHLWDVLRKLFTDPVREQMRARLTPSGRVSTHDLHTFYYPRAGARALPQGYADEIRRCGGRFRFGTRLERIDWHGREVLGTADGEEFRIPFDGLVSTIPLDALVPLLTPEPPREVSEMAGRLRYRAILLVNLCVNKPRVIEPFWIYYTNRFFNRISEYRHFSSDLAPPGKTGICLEIGCDVDDETWTAPDDEIVHMCVNDLENLGLLTKRDIEGEMIIRESNAYPIYDVGYKDRVRKLVTWLQDEAGIFTAGRQGRFLYINQDAAIISGLEAGKAMHERLEGLESGHSGPGPGPARRKIIG